MKSTNKLSFHGYQRLTVVVLLLLVSCTTETKVDLETGVQAPTTDIHTAIITDDVDAVKQHIAAKSDLNEKEPMAGSTPLITATVFGKTEIAKLLIEAGVDLGIQNNDGSTALHTAAFFCRPDIVKMLIDSGADRSITNIYGQIPYATVSGPFEEVKSTYQQIGAMLEPMGLVLDMNYIETTRPQIASMLQ